MKISDILNRNERLLSFEVFPPKTDAAFDSIKEATEKIASLSPAFMSVTYGAGGGTSRYTLEIAKNIEERYSVPTLAHLTCVSSTRETVRARIAEMRSMGIENVMALRGDIPAEMQGTDRSTWHYRHAVELVRELSDAGDFCIGGACYPEMHPESKSREEDISYLKEKADAGCSFLTTQMFFDNSLFYSFLERAKAAGIDIPIIPGVMPITSKNQVERIIFLSGSHLPKELLSLIEKYGDDAISMRNAGVEYATEQIEDMYKNGVNYAHVYSMNKPEVAEAIKKNLF